ncbi:MAG TPA: hypothetical protein PLO20_09520, partial [Thermogutta sp.]|nr:hypothetical protein [Thermogutta sp.]
PANTEVCYWKKGDRVYALVVQSAPVTGSMTGGGGAEQLKVQTISIEVEFARNVRDVRNERTGESLGDGNRFRFDFPLAEAVFLSFLE